MMQKPLLIVAGLPELAGIAKQSGVFPHVLTADSVQSLLSVFGEAHKHTNSPDGVVKPDDVVLVIGNTLLENVANVPLTEVLRKLTGAGYHVIIISVTAHGAELQQLFPRTGLLPVPVKMNDLLFAINTFGYRFEPVDHAAGPVAKSNQAPNQPAKQTDRQPNRQTPDQIPVEDIASPAGGGWGTPAPLVTAAAPTATRQERPNATPTQWQPQRGQQEPTPVISYPDTQTGTRPSMLTAPARDEYLPARREVPANNRNPAGQSSGRPALFQSGTNNGPVARADSYTSAPTVTARRGFVITVAVAKGGTGKSGLSVNLAAFLAGRLKGQRKTVCVIDANFQQADIGKYLGGYRPNINTIADEPELQTRERILDGLYKRPEMNLWALLGPALPDDANPLIITTELYLKILELLKYHFDYIIIDTPVAEKYHDTFSKFALPKADFIVVPVTPNITTVQNADNWLKSAVVLPKHAGGAGIDPSKIGIVLNRTEDGIGYSLADVQRDLCQWIWLGHIDEDKHWKAANNNNEIVATKGFVEIAQALSVILYRVTGEPILVSNLATPEKSSGIGGAMKRLFRRGQ